MKHFWKLTKFPTPGDPNYIMECHYCGTRIYMYKQVVRNLLLVRGTRINTRAKDLPRCVYSRERLVREDNLARRRLLRFGR